MTPPAASPRSLPRGQTLEAIGSRHPALPSFSPFRRKPTRTLLIEINPYQILVAGIRGTKDGITVIESAAEFVCNDDVGLSRWLDEKFGVQRMWVAAIGSLLPAELVLQRENLQPRKLAEADYLPELLRQQRRINETAQWTTAALDPFTGTLVPPAGNTNSGLLLGLPHNEIERFQQRLLDHRLLPRRIEVGILPLLGAISGLAEARQDRRATVVVILEQDHTTAYIVGKEGVHTPPPVPHGFSSIVQAVRKEFDLTTADEVRSRLHHPDDELMLRATKFVRAIGRDLKPLVDSYEMTTGQPVGEIHCACLPAALQWIAEPLAQVMQRPAMAVDLDAWLPTARLQLADDIPPLGAHWLSALSLAAAPAPTKGVNGVEGTGVPWRFDCRFPAQTAAAARNTREFRTGAVLALLASACLTFALWQWSVIRSLDADTAYWQRQIASNQRLFDELHRATTALRLKTERFDHAEALMRKPLSATDFILTLGRSLPPNMQVERIEATAGRIAMSGRLREPPDQSSLILGRYMEELRRTPAIGPRFASIALTALQRQNDTDDALTFEISFMIQEDAP